jgi:Zn-dependent peptidase ImmA (M78 family)
MRSPIEVLNANRPATPPVDVEKLATELGLLVYLSDLPTEIAGKIIKEASLLADYSGFSVHINRRDNPRRQRFTLAHEIAHYILHRDLIGDGVIDDALYRSKLGDIYERQANRMAADILMPAPLVRSEYRIRPAIAALAQAFNVSKEAMAIRVNELRLGP